MKCISYQESDDWMKQRLPGVAFQEKNDLVPTMRSTSYHTIGHAYPEDSGRKVALSKSLYTYLKDAPQCLVLIQNARIWPSSGHIPLLNRLRQALGEQRSSDEFPGHLFSSTESDDIISFIVLSIEFLWETIIVTECGLRVMHLSHDEYFDLWGTERAPLQEFESILRSW